MPGLVTGSFGSAAFAASAPTRNTGQNWSSGAAHAPQPASGFGLRFGSFQISTALIWFRPVSLSGVLSLSAGTLFDP